MTPDLNQRRLKDVLVYDKASCTFRWKASCKVAGSVDAKGHRVIRVDGKLYQATQLVVLYHTGNWPVGKVQFKGGVYSLRLSDLIYTLPKEAQLEEQRQKELAKAKAGMQNGTLVIAEKDLDRLLKLFAM